MRTTILVVLSLLAVACDRNAGNLVSSGEGDLSHALVQREDAGYELRSVCGDGAPTAAGRVSIDRAPYVQLVTADSARVLWTSAIDRDASVRLTLPDGERVADVVGARTWSTYWPGRRLLDAHLVGLEPDTTYCYELRSGGIRLTARAGLRTAPAPGGTVRFIAFGDSGDGSPEQRAVRDQMETVPFDLAVVTGDLAYGLGTPEQIDRGVFAVYGELMRSLPFFPVAGNHDYETDEAAPLREAFALPENGGGAGKERWYSFDWGDVHFVALDTQQLGAAQEDWLEADLAANELPWVVAYLHKPPWSSGSHGSAEEVRDSLVPILTRHGVQLLLAGHDHDYERTEPIFGMTTIVTGGGGVNTKPVGTSWFTAYSESVMHFVYVEVEGDRLVIHAIDGTGHEFDSALIER